MRNWRCGKRQVATHIAGRAHVAEMRLSLGWSPGVANPWHVAPLGCRLILPLIDGLCTSSATVGTQVRRYVGT
jgi:hypothetical protein